MGAIALPGRFGTAFEIALALDIGKPLVIAGAQPLLNLEEIDGEGFCRVVSAGQAERSTLVLDTLEELIARWNEKQGIAEAVSTP